MIGILQHKDHIFVTKIHIECVRCKLSLHDKSQQQFQIYIAHMTFMSNTIEWQNKKKLDRHQDSNPGNDACSAVVLSNKLFRFAEEGWLKFRFEDGRVRCLCIFYTLKMSKT